MTFIQARNFTSTSGRQIDLIVVHDMEAPEGPRTAENVANWFAGPSAPRASAHWCIDGDSTVRCVADKDVAWHAPGANHNGLGYEHAGYARQTREEWLDPYSRQMLTLSAGIARADCSRYNIPVQFVDAAGLKAGRRGITTHAEVSRAFRRSTHTDPGPHFPMDFYLGLIRGAAPAPGPAATVALPGEILRRGSRGQAVKDWQFILAGAGLIPSSHIDGIFGPETERATRAWQKKIGVTADGIVGPKTRAQTARVLAWVAATQGR